MITKTPLKLFYILSISFISIVSIIIIYCFSISSELPSLQELENPKIGLKTQLFSRNQTVIGAIYKENRTNVTYEQLPSHLVDALTSTEDRRFFDHSGIDIIRFGTAVGKTIINKLTGLFVQQGGGTLTMQTARQLYTGRAGTIKRKLSEMMIAMELERTYSKKEIIEIFFNTMFYGHRADGIQTAAKTYFNKRVEDLTIEEGAVLVGLLQRPSQNNPISAPEIALRRRNNVLYFMLSNDKINREQYDSLKLLPLVVSPTLKKDPSPYFRNRLERELTELGKIYGFNVEQDGLQVFTTLDTTVQLAMDTAIQRHLADIQKQSLNAVKSLELRARYLKDDSTFSSKKQADSTYFANQTVQFGFIAIDQKTGEVLGHMGGREGFYYDHVFQGERQPGSLIKPFVYAVAINNGMSPSDKVLDTPYILYENDTVPWTPDNWDNKSRGLVTLRYALKNSINFAVLNLQDQLGGTTGGPSNVKQLLQTMGITSNIYAVPSLPLGTNVVRPIELVSAFGAFANSGILVENHTIIQILDKHGNVIYNAQAKRKEVLNENTAFIITSMLQDVVNSGTAGAIRGRSQVPYNIQVAGKTGTTNDHTDIWTMAYTPRFTVCIWFGMDNPKHKINLWSAAAVPVVGDFIKKVYEQNPSWANDQFKQPDGVVKVSICGENDHVQLSNAECPIKVMEFFRKEFIPTEQCNIHTGKSIKKKKDIF